MDLSVVAATEHDAPAIARLRTETANDLARAYGPGHWSSGATAQGVARDIATSRVIVARDDDTIIATVRLTTKKPWAIDRTCFAPIARPLYLTTMAVAPVAQRRGVGRRLVDYAKQAARTWPADAIWLDAYDAPAGAGTFYEKCGFRVVGRRSYRGVPLIYFEWLVGGG
jgi:GNAT superfamily N-acetyltransferase